MTNWNEPVMTARVFDVAKVFVWLSTGMVLYHDIISLPFDYSILSGTRARRWPQIFYFGIKISWWIYFCLNIVVTYSLTKPGSCQILVDSVEVSMGLICTFASVLLACRTVCVYQGKTRSVISGVLTVGILAVFATWMSGAGDVTAVWVPNGGNPWQEGACNFTNVATSYSAKYVVTVAYDFLVLILTVVGVIRLQGSSRLGSILMSQGVAYFSMTAIAYLIVAVLCLMQLSPIMTQIGAVPSSAIAVMASTRLYIDLAEAARPANPSSKGTAVDSSQLSNGTGEKFASYFRKSRIGGPSSPVKNAFDIPYPASSNQEDGNSYSRSNLKQDSTSDLESQKSGSNSDGGKNQVGMEPILLSQHPYSSAASGLPVFPSQTSPRSAITQEFGIHNQSNVVTSGQKLAIAVERSCEVRSDLVPSDVNFVAQDDRQSDEYPNLRRQSS